MSSFKSIIKHPIVAPTIATLVATLILKLTGYLPTLVNWLKGAVLFVTGLLMADIQVWNILVVGLAVWLLRKLLKKNKKSQTPQTKKLTETEGKILNLFLRSDDAHLGLDDIARDIDEMELITKHTLESLEGKNLIRTGGMYGEIYFLSKYGREVVAKTILKKRLNE